MSKKSSQNISITPEDKEAKIDYEVGIYLNKLVGDTVKKGDVLATVYLNKKADLNCFDKIFTIK